jgi:uncharacterized sulfatase
MKKQAILFLIDTQGANCLGCYQKDARLGTPYVDQFATQGVQFERAYTCSPVCGPARSAIFTGLYPHSNGVVGNDMAPHQDIPHVGQRLQKHGIRTACIGKWHLDGSDYFGDGRCPPGWDPDYWFDGRNYLDSLPDDHARDFSRRILSADEIRQHRITPAFTHAHRIVERACRFLEAHRDEDFLLVISIDEPHHPHIAPEPFVSQFDDYHHPVRSAGDSLDGKPLSQREWAHHFLGKDSATIGRRQGDTLKFPPFFACNSYCDWEVGRALAAIEQWVPSALVAYTTDHGDMLGAHGLSGKGPAVYEEITRVPLLIRWPGRIAPLSRIPAPVSHIDLVPTFLDFFDVPSSELLQGKSLLPSLVSGRVTVSEPVFIEFHRFEVDHDGFGAFFPIRAAVWGQYKLSLNLLDLDEFYDLAVDPHEMCNLIDQPLSAELELKRDLLHDAILNWMDKTRDPYRGPPWKRRPWRHMACSSWGGPTRPRPNDPEFYPETLLYDTGKPTDRRVYAKG